MNAFLALWLRLGAWLRARSDRHRTPAPGAEQAAALLTQALAEDDAARRVARLREALAAGERLAGEPGDVVVMEASLHLGERLRADGARDEAHAHLSRALERSFRVPDPVGRHRRAGVLTRLGILAQEDGQLDQARLRYEEALALGADADGSLLLGMLTQAAFNLGLLESELGHERQAEGRWEQAVEMGTRSGHASGWDPAAIAAFNLGHLHVRRGEPARARARLESVAPMGEASGTPLGRMAVAKAALALATLAERDALLGEAVAARHYERALALGRDSSLPETRLAAVQASLGLGEYRVHAGRIDEAVPFYRDALRLTSGCEPEAAARFSVLAQLRLGQALAETGEREESALRLRGAFAAGRGSADPTVREWAGQAACNLHRVLGSLDRWDEARALAAETRAFTRTLESGIGRALDAAAAYAQAFQSLHDGDPATARAGLAEVARLGRSSGHEVGERVAVDALLLAGHLDRQAARWPEAASVLREAIGLLRERRGPEVDALTAMAQVHLGHVRMSQERAFDAQQDYTQALERGRASGQPAGRAAAANAALNLGAMLAGEVPESVQREHFESARALGRASGTPLGEEVARQAEQAIERLAAGEQEGESGEDGEPAG